MTIWGMMFKEICHRRTNFFMGVVSVAVAITCLVGALTLLKAHDAITLQILQQKQRDTEEEMASLQEEMRKSMLKLGFNLVILPKEQDLSDWHSQDQATTFMPEEYADRLAQSRVVTVRHLLPCLQLKIEWPEMKRTVILVGSRGEVPKLHKSPKAPLVQPVPSGKMVLGYELHRSLGLKPDDKATLLGRTFTVHKCHQERGSRDDITVWIGLEEAQELLNRKGLINAILAIECLCSGTTNLARVRSDVMRILPGTQVIEQQSKVLVRAEARMEAARQAKAAIKREDDARAKLRSERERLASFLVPLIMVACALWVGGLTLANVRERAREIAILRAMGVRSRQVLAVFLTKALLTGLVGGAVGLALGIALGSRLGASLEGTSLLALRPWTLIRARFVALALLLGPLLAVLASWIPAELASRQDPAAILGKE